MSDIAIHVEDLSKQYRLGQWEAYKTLKEKVSDSLAAPLHRLASLASGAASHAGTPPSDGRLLWALRDVSFEVKRGDVIGIIGRNGAGKSTLLKILSRITQPTRGYARIRGRVGALLEVGTGFHPELTGRENVYLNGAILGMRRHEIKRKFDEIVAFSEIERFIDTPVKRYSSGMYTRLAFAVAAYLEPEILLVDEVLAVGDAAFQQKCLNVMGQMGQMGRTVIFISHNLTAIEALCHYCFLLEGGRLVAGGSPRQMVEKYLAATLPPPARVVDRNGHTGRLPDSIPMMRAVEVSFGSHGEPERAVLFSGGDLKVSVSYILEKPIARPVLSLVIRNQLGVNVLSVNNDDFGAYSAHGVVAAGKISCQLRNCPFSEGRYFVDLSFGDAYHNYDVVENAFSFDVVFASDVFGAGTGQMPGSRLGVIVWPAQWGFEADETPVAVT